ncbi:phosphonate ABC transporter, permease protein PhnE [Ruania halotolerans]|uniref:phosphonate ABC transporter, permease protein PhnE n=1 Tax=Ruania halotolerans TaxID=2897773 RepID=UPI001E33E594|nr:phosphonate ABC transporter, permease protein PhnE [Ruania halotolerans]UFU05388.1 phosphonate ABC transporter, permease protein PhnE [Ruania halotolerans]
MRTAEATARKNTPAPPSKVRTTIWLIVSAAIVLWALWQVDARWERVGQIVTEAPRYFGLMSQGLLQNPIAEPWSAYWSKSIALMIESLQMAWIGTLIGAIISFPIAFLAASNVAPRPVVLVVRQVLNIIRAIPEIVFALVFMIPIFGLGPLAGALALGIGSVGTLGKLSSEAIEGIDLGPMEALDAAGASKIQLLRWAVVPQVLPEIVAFWLYRFEINIRAGAILGIVGAGGIGSILGQLFNGREWGRIGITLVVIIVVTVIVDQISAAVRQRIISGPGRSTSKADIPEPVVD